MRAYAGLVVSYEITPLLKTTNYVFANLADRGTFVSPNLAFQWSEDFVVAGGAQFFLGDSSSEYHHGHNLFYAQAQYFF